MGYEVLAVRYGTRQTRKSEAYLNYHVYGEPDAAVGMDYFFWVLRDGERTIVVDTGFSGSAGARRNRTLLEAPVHALSRLGIDAHGVPQVIVTHAHYDHIGGLPEFTGAEIVMSRREYEFWTGPMASRAQFAASAEDSELRYLARLRETGRLTLTAGCQVVAPGVELVEVGGHTPGQLVVAVATREGTAVLASDALHYYEEVERDRPFSVVSDLADMYRAYDTLRELASDPRTALVAGHDPAVRTRFPESAAGGDIVRIAAAQPAEAEGVGP